MDRIVKYRHVLVGLATLVLLALVIPVRGSDLPAAMGLMLIEAFVIGLAPLVIGFLGQVAMRERELRDRVLFLCALVIALALETVTNTTGSSPARHIVSVGFFALLLTWFASFGAMLARALRRRRSVAA